MRNSLLAFGIIAIIMSCNNGAAKTEAANNTTLAKADVALPYTADYSSGMRTTQKWLAT